MQRRRGKAGKPHLKSKLECEKNPLNPGSIQVSVKFSVHTAVTMRSITVYDVTPGSLL
jgi:hypothetical protein